MVFEHFTFHYLLQPVYIPVKITTLAVSKNRLLIKNG